MKTKRILSLLLTILMLCSFLAIGAESSSAAVKIKDSDFGSEYNADIKLWVPSYYVNLAKKQCDRFVREYPDRNITIEIVAQSEDVAATQMLSDPEAAADVFGFASDQLGRLYNAKVIAPVPPTFAKDIKKTHYKNAVTACKKGGTLFAYPETGNGYYLVYDKRIVSAKQAKSLEATLKACKKAGKKFIMDIGTGYYSCSVAFAGGLRLNGLKADGYTQKFNKYNEKTVIATLKAFSKLTHKYSGTFVSLGPENICSGFSTGSVGAGVDGSWNAVADKDALGKNLGATKLPTIKVNGKNRPLTPMYGYKMIGVNAASMYPRTAQMLAYYLSSEKCQKERMTKLSWSPTIKSVGSSKSAKKDVTVSAMLKQNSNIVIQTDVAYTFWDPMANMGNKLVAKSTNPDTYDFKKLLKQTIKNITAE